MWVSEERDVKKLTQLLELFVWQLPLNLQISLFLREIIILSKIERIYENYSSLIPTICGFYFPRFSEVFKGNKWELIHLIF